MKKLLLFLALFVATGAFATEPCHWAGDYVKCYPATGLFLNEGRSLRLGPDTDDTHYVELKSAGSMAVDYTLSFPSASPLGGQSLIADTFGDFSWYTPFTSASFDTYKTGLPMKYAAQAASTANVNMGAGNPGTIDGVDFTFGGTVLLKNQTDATQNGLWVVDSGGVWTRQSTMPDNTSSAFDAIIAIDPGGTVNGSTIWFSRATGDANVPFVQIPTTASNAPLTASRDLVSDASGFITTNAITGSGSGVRQTSPSLTTPNVGVATATSINKVAITAPATGSTLTIADGKTLSLNTGNMTINANAANSSITFPTTGTVATLAGSETLTNKTLSGNTAATLISGSGTLTLNTTGTVTVPNATDTLVGKATTDTLTNKDISSTTNTYRAASSSVTGAVSYEDTGTFNANFTGPRSFTLTIAYSRVGTHVTLSWNDNIGVSCTVSTTLSASSGTIPSALRPNRDGYLPVWVNNNSANVMGYFDPGTNGSIDIGQAGLANFSATGTCGIYRGTVSYITN